MAEENIVVETNEGFEQLIRKRASMHVKLSGFCKFIEQLQTLFPNSQLKDSNKIFELEQRVENIRKIIEDFDEIQTDIEQYYRDTDIQLLEGEREKFETAYFASLGKAKHILMSNTPAQERVSDDNESVASVREGFSKLRGIKLPTISLPSFDGDSNDWLGFRDTFESLIHNCNDISNIQKFHYLKSAAGPKVLEIIGNLEFSSENYQIAWDTLCQRFNNVEILVQNHIKMIYHLDKINFESSTALRKIVDVVTNRLRALNALKEPTQHWDSLVIFLIYVKLDDITREKWDEKKTEFKRPILKDFTDFLIFRANILEAKEKGNDKIKIKKQIVETKGSKYKTFLTSNTSSSLTPSCSFCQNQHNISECVEFSKLSKNERLKQVKQKGLCINCLRVGHMIKQCRAGPCRICKVRHNTLLHFDRDKPSTSSQNSESQNVINNFESVTMSSCQLSINNQVILSTVAVRILDSTGKAHTVRALLDAGSQTSFISLELCQTLKLDCIPCSLTVGGLNETHSEIKYKCSIPIHSLNSNFSMQLACLVIPQITGNLPNFQIDLNKYNIPTNIKLADPNFHFPGRIDILIGADYFWDLMCIGQMKLDQHGPILQKSRFGWIVAGPICSENSQILRCNLSRKVDIDKQMSRFWELEEFPDSKPLSKEEKLVEDHFSSTVKRDENNRFIVTIPLKASLDTLGDSSKIAKKRFYNLERKFNKTPEFENMYRQFIDEYRKLGHMVKVDNPNLAKHSYYMPHHGVLKESSISTKLRVVFDSSCPSSSGYSFNDLQMIGPTIQSDLFSLLILNRKHNYVIAGDIEKMYRMCLVTPTQRSLQRIFWRDNPRDELSTYELTTVTYGTSAASFLAIRCLYQLGIDCNDAVISDVIKSQFYVDDMLSGADTIEEASRIANEVSKVLENGGFRLCKFISNSPEVLKDIESRNKTNLIDLGTNENARTLGIIWNANIDCFLYNINSNFNKHISKRVILSESSQIFDPLGLLSPTIILAKIILRDIWLEKINWDDSLSLNLHTRWLQFRDELHHLSNIKIPRQIVCRDFLLVEIHGFSDSSALAYGACIYLRSQDKDGNILVHLICAKSRVAPLKTQTIPRLELVAALLMCRLVTKVKASLKMRIDKSVYWTDSTIVLGWINTEPNLLQIFVANRVAAIQEISDSDNWRHVPTSFNPADHVSRGVRPSLLNSIKNYWYGPEWLSLDQSNWPPLLHANREPLPDLKRIVHSNLSIENWNIFENHSNLTRLERIVSYCLRFKNNCKTRANRNSGPLTYNEIKNATICLIRVSQRQSFKDELSLLQRRKALDSRSKILKLSPFIDENQIIRVGGRLSNSNFSYNKKHPILLCSKHRFTKLLFEREHKLLLHSGPQNLLAHIRDNYWPISGRDLARKITHACVTCFRVKPSLFEPIMGNLPKSRVDPAPPFFITGVDYAGPFRIKDRQGRGCKVNKAYISIFVCFVTRAIHIELVPDLTSEAFIAAFRRFVSRRGKPSRMYSDNGTNFVGANNTLKELGAFLKLHDKILSETFENEGVSWSFIPAYSPHFGGLWEAGVKVTKYHLLRIAGNALLTFEQMYTLLVQIEGILNSRPLHPLSPDPLDLNPLTPAHFLIGRPITSLADRNLLEVSENRLKHHQRIQQLQQHFWARWSTNHISELQQRCKWRTNQHTLHINDMVVIKEDDLPPFKWCLGRIVELHPGNDGVARVASIKVKNGLIRRSFAKICPLPMPDVM